MSITSQMDAISWRYYIVFCVWIFVQACVVYFFFPETYGLGLKEVSQIFGDDIIDIKMTAKGVAINEKQSDDILKNDRSFLEDVSSQPSDEKKKNNVV